MVKASGWQSGIRIGGLLGGHDAGDAGGSEHVPLVVLAAQDQRQRLGGHGNKRLGTGFALGHLLVGHIHHMGFTALVQMRQVGLGLLGIGLVHRLLSEVGDKVARLGAGIELIADQLLPTQLASAGGAGQTADQGAIGESRQRTALHGGAFNLGKRELTEHLAKTLYGALEQHTDRFRHPVLFR